MVKIVLWAAFMCIIAVSNVSGLTVSIPGQGSVMGGQTTSAFTGRTIHQFFAIPFAENPTGSRRFKQPASKIPWTGTRDHTQPGIDCPSLRTLLDLSPENVTPDLEDCLHVSVFTHDVTGSRPVMVYFHGGGFMDGAAQHHPPNYLLEKDVVLVTAQYRLGPLGFLSTMSTDIPGNAGMLDCIMALQWVQKYISNFGGNPNSVTIFGQSAGGAIVDVLMLSPLATENLFHKVIIQSGASYGSWIYDQNPERNARDIAQFGGCNQNAPLTDLNQCLMNMDIRTLLLAFTSHVVVGTPNGVDTIGGHRFTIGGPSNFLPYTPFKIMRMGLRRKNIPVMAGVTKHDGTFLMTGIYDILDETIGINNSRFNSFQLIDTINQVLGLDDSSLTLTAYQTKSLFSSSTMNTGNFMEMINGLIDACGAIVIKGPTLRAAQINAYENPSQTYLYSFDYKGEFTRFGYGADTSHYPFSGGVHHSDDNLYLFPYPPEMANLNAADRQIAQMMVEMWTSFATTGVPTSPSVSSWPPMTRVNGPYLHINAQPSVGQDYYDEFSVTARDGLFRENGGLVRERATPMSHPYLRLQTI